MFLLKEFQTLLGAALPLLVQVGVIYLILRFTFAVSNVLVRLASLNAPPPPPKEEEEPSVLDPDDAQPVAALGEGSGEEEDSSEESAGALPETTTED
jgi:hypothetical protein